jgi:hypothetical protein
MDVEALAAREREVDQRHDNALRRAAIASIAAAGEFLGFDPSCQANQPRSAS